jgi:curli biogenesis system outer membrane secretion channel CsgG
MTTARIAAFIIFLTPLALTGCPGKSASTAGGHDAAFYNTHLAERRATLDRCNKLDPATQAVDIDCQSAVYSNMYGPSQLKTPASP